MQGIDDRGFRKVLEGLDIVDAGGRQALTRGDTGFVDFKVEDFIDSHDLRIAKGSEAFRQLCLAFLKASGSLRYCTASVYTLDHDVGLEVKPVGEPNAGNSQVRFDERGGETE